MNPDQSLHIRDRWFWLFLALMVINLASLSVFGHFSSLLRYIRQPSLVLAFGFLLQFFPRSEHSTRAKDLEYFFFYLVFFFCFNSLTSIAPVNTISYAAWLLFFLYFLYEWLFLRSPLSFRELLYQMTWAGFLTGFISLAISLIGGYVLGLDLFFDERYNYTQMRMVTEFSGLFGSNNTLGIITFFTLVFSLLLFEMLRSFKWWAPTFLALALLLSWAVFFIGNRASMACSAVFWLLYLIYVRRSLFGLFFFVIVGFLGSVYFQDTLVEKLRLEQFEGGNLLGNRSKLFEEALDVAREMDFFGVGFHNQRVARKYYDIVSEGDKEYNFHNTYLAVYTELGLLGFLWIPGFLLLYVFRFPGRFVDPFDLKMVRMLKSLLLGLMIFYLPVEDSINSPGSPTFFFFWSAFFVLVLGLKSSGHQNSQTS